MLCDCRFRAVCTMACLGSNRLCARGLEKLCQIGRITQLRRKSTPALVKIKEFDIRPIFQHNFPGKCERHLCGRGWGGGPGGGGVLTASASPSRAAASSATAAFTTPSSSAAAATPIRSLSSQQQQPGTGPVPDYVDPYTLLEDDLKHIYHAIRHELAWNTGQEELRDIATYYFDGQGKALRPMVVILMARAINYHIGSKSLLKTQMEAALIAEMIHSASLIHDDVIDQSDFRRGKPSVNVLWSHKKVAMAGDYILAVASMMLSRLRNDEVTLAFSQILADLVQGEFMQLGSKETENERFAHYLTKTYRKTASLIANSVKSAALLAGADEQLTELAFEYGRNIGLAFQLVDDLLDFVSSSDTMGKPTAADLKLGLATAPVLFACEKFPELNPMIMRRFQEPGDVEKAFELVHKSQGLEQTRFLARKHCNEAIRLASSLADSEYQKGLVFVPDLVINRMK